MNVEAALIELGDKPLRRSPYSSTLLLVLNAYLPGNNSVSRETTGQEVLSLVYQLPDTSLQERLLEREVGQVRGRDSYRTVLLAVSGLMGIFGVALAVAEIVTPKSTGVSELINGIIGNTLAVFKFFL